MTAAPDRVKVFSSTAGTGTSVVLGARTHEFFMTPTEAGMLDGYAYDYIIEQGSDWEYQQEQIYTASGTTIARGTPKRSRIGGAALGTSKITLDGTEVVYFPTTEWALGNFKRSDCYLSFVNSSTIRLDRVNGTLLTINGLPRVIPSAGVTLGPGGLTASTLYYIYAYINVATMTLEASTTAFAIDATTGVAIKSGDATRTLVGIARPATGPVWQGSGANIQVLSYYNQRRLIGTAITVGTTFSTTSVHRPDAAISVNALTWVDKPVYARLAGMAYGIVGTTSGRFGIGIDSTTAYQFGSETWGYTNTYFFLGSAHFEGLLAVGNHTFNLLAQAGSGSTIQMDAGASSSPSIYVTVWG
jgi:hypothetical protein